MQQRKAMKREAAARGAGREVRRSAHRQDVRDSLNMGRLFGGSAPDVERKGAMIGSFTPPNVRQTGSTMRQESTFRPVSIPYSSALSK